MGKEIMKKEELTLDVSEKQIGTIMAKYIVAGDLSGFTQQEQAVIYFRRCQDLGLDPFTKPFDMIKQKDGFGGTKVILYANSSCSSQLGAKGAVSVEEAQTENLGDVYVTKVRIRDRNGRAAFDLGAVTIANLRGEQLANAIMKSSTKAYRRAILKLYGVALPDETEIETIPNAVKVEFALPDTLVKRPKAKVKEKTTGTAKPVKK